MDWPTTHTWRIDTVKFEYLYFFKIKIIRITTINQFCLIEVTNPLGFLHNINSLVEH